MSIANAILTPASGTTQSIKLEPGTAHQFGFKLSDIINATPRADGSLELKLSNNSVVVIENFKDLVNSKDICGEDSAVLLLDDKAGPEGFSLINLVKSMAGRFEDRSANDNEIALNAPTANATKEVVMEPGMNYLVNFDIDQVGKTIDGDNLILSFRNGGIMILRDYAAVTAGELPPALTLADGTVVDSNSLITAACAVDMPKLAALAASAIEPAAGDETPVVQSKIATKVAQIETASGGDQLASAAESLANIEPAAGGDAGGGPNRGYGYSSDRDVIALGGLNPLGPIAPTDLNGAPPFVPPILGQSQQTTVVVPPPPVLTPPTITVESICIEEDNVATVPFNIALTNGNPAEILTVTISGIPSGWTVLNTNGTYDAANGTWTITLPAGQNFTGDLLLSPPANSDVDSPVLTVTASSNLTSAQQATFDVCIDAVADAPTLTVSNLTIEEGMMINFPITTAVTDTDGSEEIIRVVITGVPVGVTLSAGILQQDGSWVLTQDQLSGLRLNTTDGSVGTYNLTVTSYVREVNTSGMEPNLLNNDANTSQQVTLVITQDDVPTLTPAINVVDETAGQPATLTGTVSGTFGQDGPGVFVANGSFSFNGSTGAALTSNGVAVIVTQSGNTYTGTAGGQTVFTITINANGAYTFSQARPLDHADASNPNDAINLVFGVQGTDSDGDVANTTITINVIDDAPVAVNDVGVVNGVTNLAVGNVLSNDDISNDISNVVSGIRFGSNAVTNVTGATVINGAFGVLTINPNGTYSYAATNGVTGTDSFTYTLRDGDGDTSSATVSFTTADGLPVIGDASSSVDETGLGPITVNGSYSFNYGTDGQGTTGSIAAVNNFTSGGSLLGGALTSGGVPVSVALAGNTYTGTAGGVTVFTLVVNTNGTYSFTLNRPLDHADGTNANDAINLNFGTLITDADGDTDAGAIVVTVRDDGVDARADVGSVTGCAPQVAGNVLSNDDVSNDVGNTISKVTVGGVDHTVPASGNLVVTGSHGVLTIAANGAYSYVANNHANGTDSFSYTLRDFDGDVDTATLTLSVSDGAPSATNTLNMVDETTLSNMVSGTFNGSYGTDGAGSTYFTVAPQGFTGFVASGSLKGGTLTSNGVAVSVALVGGKYVGTAGGVTVFEVTIDNAGAYSFRQFRALDHADGTNANDVINLSFCVDVVDCDGDLATANLIIGVKDDAPVAVNDVGVVNGVTNLAVGNVLSNDDISNDISNVVSGIRFGSNAVTNVTGATVINGAFGVLTINPNGTYSYAATNGVTGTDSFTYTLRDGDGDTSSATVSFTTADGLPVIGDASSSVDETGLGPITVNGSYSFNYGTDGQGTTGSIAAVNNFTSGGSLLGGALTSGGVPVSVALAGNTYTGTAGGVTVFTLVVNTNGTYSFTLNRPLDHADGTNANDAINLNFGTLITDADGDTDAGAIVVTVRDDGVDARADVGSVTGCAPQVAGNVLSNDDVSNDVGNTISKVTVGGVDHTVPASGNLVVTGSHGVLTIAANGAYSYVANNHANGTDSFSYTLRDFDGDVDTATLTLSVSDGAPSATNTLNMVDETTLSNMVSGTFNGSYGTDGAGSTYFTVAPQGFTGFVASGSLKGGTLTSNGVAVSVALVGGKYVGTAGGVTVFEVTIDNAGAYSFRQFRALDHADGTNANDVINLSFCVDVVDCDGDLATANLIIGVKDDAPVVVSDYIDALHYECIYGNIVANDHIGNDVNANALFQVQYNGVTFNVPAGSHATTIVGQYGVLEIASNGNYKYTVNPGQTGQHIDYFTYSVRDSDHDVATGTFAVRNDGDCGCFGTSTNVNTNTNTNTNININTNVVDTSIFAGTQSVAQAQTIATALSTASAKSSIAGGVADVISFDDDLQVGINNFITQTTTNDTQASSSVVSAVASTSITYNTPINDNFDDHVQHLVTSAIATA